MDELLVTNNLTKKYKHQAAVNNVSINVRRGEIYGLVGKTVQVKRHFLK